VADAVPFRSLPDPHGDAGWFWTAGADGELRVLRCQTCRYWVHPPSDICPNCLGRALAPEAVSGDGTLFSFAVNHQVADKRVEVPYVVALVELPEQEGLRLLSNLVDCDIDDARIGMPVRVRFEQHDDDTFVPVWKPA
jgi:uncharacterized OB-fold protein